MIEGEALEKAIAERSTSKRELLDEQWEGSVLIRRWRITPSRELPGVITKLLGKTALSYVQTSRVDRASRKIYWTIEVAAAQGRADIGGVLDIEETPTGCRRTMTSEIVIRVPLLGGRVEAAIAKDVERTYVRSHRLVSGLLEES